jgi:CubicO group peptidase (beta-lactamase class C family)
VAGQNPRLAAARDRPRARAGPGRGAGLGAGRARPPAGGAGLPALYQRLIFGPFALRATSYEPQGPIAGPHANGYGISPAGASTDATNWHPGIGAGGGIISNARDTAIFLTSLMRGTLLSRRYVAGLRGDDLWLGGENSGCAGQAYGWSGGGWGYKTNVWVNADGTRVAVLLLNARHWGNAQAAGDQAAKNALARLYCRA